MCNTGSKASAPGPCGGLLAAAAAAVAELLPGLRCGGTEGSSQSGNSLLLPGLCSTPDRDSCPVCGPVEPIGNGEVAVVEGLCWLLARCSRMSGMAPHWDALRPSAPAGWDGEATRLGIRGSLGRGLAAPCTQPGVGAAAGLARGLGVPGWLEGWPGWIVGASLLLPADFDRPISQATGSSSSSLLAGALVTPYVVPTQFLSRRPAGGCVLRSSLPLPMSAALGS